MANGHGGLREGSFIPASPEREAHRVDGEYWKSRKTEAEALKVERENAVATGDLIPRPAVAAAAATAIAVFAQTARSIPDELERRLGLTPEVVEAIAVSMDEALAGLSKELEALATLGGAKK